MEIRFHEKRPSGLSIQDFLVCAFLSINKQRKQRGKVCGNAATKQGAHKPTWKHINAQKNQ